MPDVCASIRAARSMNRYLKRIEELMRLNRLKARFNHFNGQEWGKPRRTL